MRRLLSLLAWACLHAQADTYLILPFFNTNSTENLDWVGESIAETTRAVLAGEGLLAVAREDRVEAYRRLSLRPSAVLTRASVLKAGEALDADHVVYGEFAFTPPDGPVVRTSKGTLRITARILNLRGMKRGAEYTELGALEDLAELQNHLAWQTLRLAAPRSAPTADAFRQRHPPVRVEAMEQYVRGLLASSPDQQIRFFQQAARIDARFSPPCFQLGRLYFARKSHRQATEWLQRVTPNDVYHREATFLLGLSRFHLADYAGAAQAFQAVAQTVPLNEVYNNLGAALSRAGQAEALANFQRALEGDANDPDYHFNVGYALWRKGDYTAAGERFRAALERRPGDSQATLLLGRCLKGISAQQVEGRAEGLERVKEAYEEAAYWQLKAMLEPKP